MCLWTAACRVDSEVLHLSAACRRKATRLYPGGSAPMGFSIRHVLIEDDGSLFLLADAKFDRMLRQPGRHPMRRFAGRRVRLAEAVIELHRRRPIRVVRLTYGYLAFDQDGVFLEDEYHRPTVDALNDLLGGVGRVGTSNVYEASSRFRVRGSRWKPEPELEKCIVEVAMGRTSVCRV